MSFNIRSGIPSLDGMFRAVAGAAGDDQLEASDSGVRLTEAAETTSICIAGPDGTGKSILAMHFASRYVADCEQYCNLRRVPEPLAFYVSSDLSHEKAVGMWENFRLDLPNRRKVPFRHKQLTDEKPPVWLGGNQHSANLSLPLQRHMPDRLVELAGYLHDSSSRARQVAFIDLASYTAGDDWGFIERLIAAMPKPEPAPATPRHLLVIDAMEGMEMFAGEIDAFGQKTTRRGRVAKLMRLAAPKCHLVLVIEEPQEGVRLAEQFVADVVVRLRATEGQGYSRRTLEIEKARGQSHIRGRHPYVIRDGRGSTTGDQINFDDPLVEESSKPQSYVDVFPSLHSMSRAVMEIRTAPRDQKVDVRAGFGIPELDEMLAAKPNGTPELCSSTGQPLHGQDDRGLPCGAVSALIGDANTQKTFLGMAFLGHVFHKLALKALNAPGALDNGDLEIWKKRFKAEGNGCAGAAVLVTSKDENNRTLATRFCEQLCEQTVKYFQLHRPELVERVRRAWDAGSPFREALQQYIESRTICRRLEIHDTPSPVLFHAIRRAIEAAQEIVAHDSVDVCGGWPRANQTAERIENGWRIRFVLDDFNSVMRTYGRVHDDPLFLPFLLLNLRREGLSSLIIETQSGEHGMPALAIGEDDKSDLRALSDYRLYTWHVPNFFGDHRIAIAAIPPMVQQDKKSPVLVRELEWHQPNRGPTPRVNPSFELYAGLDTNKPTLVPLRVHLYAETPAWEAYISRLDELWKRVFEPPTLERSRRRKVVEGEKAEDYELMQKVCDLHANTNLDYSLIVQVDEFWHHRETFRSQFEYLTRPIDREPDRPHVESRRHWFVEPSYGFGEDDAGFTDIDRIPFVADFGFLACREEPWKRATAIDSASPRRAVSVDAENDRNEAAEVWDSMKRGEHCDWARVLKAACYVAKWESARQGERVPAFDLAMVAPETFSCLMLEMWFSEIYLADRNKGQKLARRLGRRDWTGTVSDEFKLSKLVRDHWLQLYSVWLLLAEALDLQSFGTREEGFGFEFGRKANPNAIVTRHWYKSAALLQTKKDDQAPKDDTGEMRFCRLPGAFSVRGDWFLAAVRGSRSDRLVDRALDLLSSSEANVDRLMRGVGLPTRDLRLENALSSRLKGWHSNDSERPKTLTYKDVLQLGVDPGSTDFHWLWRGNLKDYHKAAPIWERWLYRALRRWKGTREFFATYWIPGFELNELIRRGELAAVKARTLSFADFQERWSLLCEELDQLER